MFNNKRYKPVLWIMISGIFVAVLLGSGLLAPTVSQADLPDRNTPIPAPSNNDNGGGGGGALLAHIELFVSPTPVGVAAAVQWQNINGDWEEVGSWSSPLENGYQRWTVEAKDFGTGPFRWVARSGGPDGIVVGTSQSFLLPAGAGETGQAAVSLVE